MSPEKCGRELVGQLDELMAAESLASDGACTDAAAEWLEQGEYLDPDTLDWPDH